MSRNIYRIFQQASSQSIRRYSRWTHRQPGKVILPFEPTGKTNLKKEKIIALDPSFLNTEPTAVSKPNKTVNTEKEKKAEEKPNSTFEPTKSKKIKTEREEKLQKRKFYLSQKKVFDDNGEIMFEKMNANDGRVSTMFVKLKTKKERMRSHQLLVEGWRLIVDGLEAKCNLNYVIFSRTEDLERLKPYLPKTGVVFYKVPYKELELFSDVETPSGIFGIFETPSVDKIKKITNPIPLHLLCDNIRMAGNLGSILRAAVGAGCGKVLLTKGCVDVWDPKVLRSAAGAHFRLPIQHSLEWDEMPSYLEPNTSIFLADSNAKIDEEEDGDSLDSQIPVLPYYGVDFSSMKHITLVIGGETEGISEESYELAAKNNGVRLNIPLQRGVDSLNTGMATAVIAFEIRKQLVHTWAKIKEKRIHEAAT